MEDIANQAGLATVNPSVRLNCLPMWCVLRSLGEDQFKFRINNIFEMMEVLNNKMAEFSSIRILSQRPEQKEFISVHEIAKVDFDLDQIFKTVSPALAFQYVSNSPPDANERVPDYFNNLNSWLGQTMQRDCAQVSGSGTINIRVALFPKILFKIVILHNIKRLFPKTPKNYEFSKKLPI